MQNQIAQRGARLLGAREDGVEVAAGTRRRGGGEHDAAEAAARGAGVERPRCGPSRAALVEQRLGLGGGADGAGDPAGEVDRDDVVAVREQRLVDGDEVADRGLRGASAAGRPRSAARRTRRSR